VLVIFELSRSVPFRKRLPTSEQVAATGRFFFPLRMNGKLLEKKDPLLPEYLLVGSKFFRRFPFEIRDRDRVLRLERRLLHWFSFPDPQGPSLTLHIANPRTCTPTSSIYELPLQALSPSFLQEHPSPPLPSSAGEDCLPHYTIVPHLQILLRFFPPPRKRNSCLLCPRKTLSFRIPSFPSPKRPALLVWAIHTAPHVRLIYLSEVKQELFWTQTSC